MIVKETNLEGCFIIKPKVIQDKRGYFLESFNQAVFKEGLNRDINFVQDNESYSSKGVLRGLHYQIGDYAHAKLVREFGLSPEALGHLTSAVQFGFIAGTLLFAILAIADRFSPSKVFFVCALLGAVVNLGTVWGGNDLISLVSIRFATGFFLAGIYPVGMKIATDYYDKGLGKSLGFLVGALVLGTAFPHFLKAFTGS
jgi:MFS family permease